MTEEQLNKAADRIVDGVKVQAYNSGLHLDAHERRLFELGAKAAALLVMENLLRRDEPGMQWGQVFYELLNLGDTIHE